MDIANFRFFICNVPRVFAMAQVAFYEENIAEHNLLVNKNKEHKTYSDQ